MKSFFYPESVAVCGVSDAPSNMARIIVENLVRFGFKGNVHPVGTSGGSLAGKKIHTGLEGIGEAPELAVLLVPAAHVPATLEACGEKGIRYVIIESGGFSELAEERKTLETQVLQIASKWGMRIIGPNCFGVTNLENGLVLPFFILNPGYMKRGTASLISQSGGLVYDTCMLASCENVGLNKVVSVGNKLMVDENDVLEYLMADEGTRTIGLYLESFTDGKRLMRLSSMTDKPIILLKANRSSAGEEIARFHTTALAGDDLVADAALRQAGILRVQNFAEMIDSFKVFSLPLMKGPRLALVTRSGGHGVLSADAAYRHGFELARFSDGFLDDIKQKKKNVIRATNPLDVGDIYNLDLYGEILDMVLREQDVDGVVFIVTYSSESDGARMKQFMRHAEQIGPVYGKPVVLCMVSNKEEWLSLKDAADVPLFTEVDYAIKALARSWAHFKNRSKRTRTVAVAASQAPDRLPLSPAAGRSLMLHPREAFALIKRYGLPVANHAVVKTLEEALDAAGTIGYPVALKIASPLLLHKTERQGVRLHLADEKTLREAVTSMKAEEYLLQKMASPGIEVIAGVKRDREFGHVLLFGLGGIFVELLKDTSIRVLPIGDEVAREMVAEIKGAALLKGFRGKPPADVETLVQVLAGISRLMADNPDIVNLDVNPLILYEEGRGAQIVDVKIERG